MQTIEELAGVLKENKELKTTLVSINSIAEKFKEESKMSKEAVDLDKKDQAPAKSQGDMDKGTKLEPDKIPLDDAKPNLSEADMDMDIQKQPAEPAKPKDGTEPLDDSDHQGEAKPNKQLVEADMDKDKKMYSEAEMKDDMGKMVDVMEAMSKRME